jgi:hypothetical protein
MLSLVIDRWAIVLGSLHVGDIISGPRAMDDATLLLFH